MESGTGVRSKPACRRFGRREKPFTPQLKHLPGFCPCVNLSVVSKIKEADNVLDANNPSQEGISKAKEKLAEGMSLLNYRQKIIKIADSSDLGWRVVQEYEANPLADESNDEKKLDFVVVFKLFLISPAFELMSFRQRRFNFFNLRSNRMTRKSCLRLRREQKER
jgi:hypothetical protein